MSRVYYDAVGNLLSITRSTGGVGAPTIAIDARINPSTVNGSTFSLGSRVSGLSRPRLPV